MVQLPNQQDLAAQVEVNVDLGYNMSVNKHIWGGLLSTRRVNCESGGDPVEEVIQAIKHQQVLDMFQLISPYTPQSIRSMMMLVANVADYYQVTNTVRDSAAAAISQDFDAAIISTILENYNVKGFLSTVIRHAMNIVESVQGFVGGQVVRACNGYNISTIKTGDRFMAQLYMSFSILQFRLILYIVVTGRVDFVNFSIQHLKYSGFDGRCESTEYNG